MRRHLSKNKYVYKRLKLKFVYHCFILSRYKKTEKFVVHDFYKFFAFMWY